jgi:putative oxidoreductase
VLAGAATPLAASAVIGTMAVAGHAVHRPNGFFVVSDGYEYVLTLGVGAAALAALGSGRWSVDHLLGLDGVLNAPVRTAIAVAAGLAGAAAQLRLYWSAPERSR